MAISAVAALVTTSAGWAAGTLTTGFMVSFATNFVLGAALKALTPKPNVPSPAGNEANRGLQVTVRGSAVNHQIVYGETKVGGVEIFNAVSSSENKLLHKIIAFTGHEISSFVKIYLNDEYLELNAQQDSNGETYYTPTNAKGPLEENSDRYNSSVRIYVKRGGQENNTAITSLTSAGVGWTTDHKLQGISYLYVRLAFDSDVFPNGVPNISAVIKGKKVYDPRADATVWSDNPALCLRDYLLNSTYGLDEPVGRVDDNYFIKAANVCQHYNYPTLTGDQRFTLNGAFTTGEQPVDILGLMLTSLGGQLWYGQGKWRLKAAHYEAPTILLNEDDLRSGVDVVTRHSRRDNFNTVSGIYRGEETSYEPTDYPRVTDALYVEQDGQELVQDSDLTFTDTSAMARRLALIFLERNRQQVTVNATFGLKAFQVQVADIIKFSFDRFDFDEKEFEVANWSFTMDPGGEPLVQLSLREIQASVFDDINDAVQYTKTNQQGLSIFSVPNIGLEVDGTTRVVSEKIVTELSAIVTATDPSRVDHVEVQYKLSADQDYLSMGSGPLGTYKAQDLIRGDYDVRARGVNTFGVKGLWEYNIGFELNPPDDPPQQVGQITYEISQGSLFLRWPAVTDLDLSYYQVQHSPYTSGAVWGSGTTLSVEKVPRPATSTVVPARSGTFLIKAFDKLGQPSLDASVVVVPPSVLPALDNSYTQTENAGFIGDKTTNVIVNTLPTPDELIISTLSGATNQGIYYFGGLVDDGITTPYVSTYIDLSTARTSRVTGFVTFNRHRDYNDSWDNIPQAWDTWPVLFDDLTQEEAAWGDTAAQIEVSITNADPATAVDWSSYEPVSGGQIVARGLRFRAVLSSTNSGVSPSIETLSIEVAY